MGILQNILSAYNTNLSVSINEFLFKLFIAIVLILVGIFLGKAIAFGLKKLAKKIDLQSKMRPSLINLIIAVVKWTVYVVFIDLALVQLPISGLTSAISKALVVIPALVGALIIILIGFGIAVFIREVIEDTEVTGWKMLSQYLFYFIIFVFGVYGLKVALISLDEFVSNVIVLILAGVFAIGLGYLIVKKEFRENNKH